MRIWDINPKKLCRNHLLGEHRELHAVWMILTQGKSGYANHPETARWKGKLRALYLRHTELVGEMKKRNYRHKTPLEMKLATGSNKQDKYLDSPEEQLSILKLKKCGCET